MDWYQNSREQWVLGVEDDASRKVLGLLENDARSVQQNIEVLDEVREEQVSTGEILEVITDHGSEIYAPNRDECGGANHPLETYLDEHGIKHTVCCGPATVQREDRAVLPDLRQATLTVRLN